MSNAGKRVRRKRVLRLNGFPLRLNLFCTAGIALFAGGLAGFTPGLAGPDRPHLSNGGAHGVIPDRRCSAMWQCIIQAPGLPIQDRADPIPALTCRQK